MHVFEIINTDVEPLRKADSARLALRMMDAHGIDALPLVDEDSRKIIGLIRKPDIEKLANQPLTLEMAEQNVRILDPDAHVFDAAQAMISTESSMLPVADKSQNFLGVLTRKELYLAIVDMLNLNEYGTVIGIEVTERDYTLAEIVRIVETEGAKILGISVVPPGKLNNHFRISLKLNLNEAHRVTSALQRFGYIITHETENTENTEDLLSRADEFLRYLNI